MDSSSDWGHSNATSFAIGGSKNFKEPIQEDPIIKLDFSQTTTLPPLMDVVNYMCHSALAAG